MNLTKKTKEDVLRALLILADEWDQDATEDQRYLDADREYPEQDRIVGTGETQGQIKGQIQLARLNAQALRDLVKEYES